MGCSMSKSAGEPRTIIIRLPNGCSNIARSFSSPSHLAGGEHVSEKPNIDSVHAVSLTSSTYGSLQLDPLEDYGEVRSRRGSSEYLMDVTSENSSKSENRPVSKYWSGVLDSSLSTSGRNSDNKKAIPLKGANNNQVEIIDMWELMDGVEDEKATLKMLRALVENPSMSGFDSEKSTPRLSTTIHTIEDVDNVFDDGGSLPTGYRFRRGSSLEAAVPVRHSHESGLNSDRVIGRTSAMLQRRRARAMQISRDVISELDELRRRNLSRSQEFNTSGKSILSRSQEFNSSGRRDMSRSQEFITQRRGLSRIQELNSARRRYLSQSQDYDSLGRNRHIRNPNLDHVRRGNLFKNQEQDSSDSVHTVESQKFARPPLAKPKEVVARRHSVHEIPRIVELKDERVAALSKPDIVLRSPMLRGIGGVERQRVRPGEGSSMASAAINIEITNKPSLRSQTLPPPERKTVPKAADPTMVNLDLNT